MNQNLSSRNQTISKGKVTTNLKRPKNEGNFGNHVDHNNNNAVNNNQFRNYNNLLITGAGGNNKSVDLKNEISVTNEYRQNSKFAGNNQIITTTDNVFGITTVQNDMSFNNSDIIQHRNQFGIFVFNLKQIKNCFRKLWSCKRNREKSHHNSNPNQKPNY